jgi:hypothetical protein
MQRLAWPSGQGPGLPKWFSISEVSFPFPFSDENDLDLSTVGDNNGKMTITFTNLQQ